MRARFLGPCTALALAMWAVGASARHLKFWSNHPEHTRAWFLKPLEQTRQARFQAPGNLLDVHQRNIAHTALDSTLVSPVQSAMLRGLFLIDLLFLADAHNTAKPDANIERY